MANMSYCQYRNTSTDLKQCIDALYEDGLDDLSSDELKATDRLYNLCREYMDAYEDAQPTTSFDYDLLPDPTEDMLIDPNEENRGV